jgi:D-serine dehydratase
MKPFDLLNKGVPLLPKNLHRWGIFDDDATFPVAVLVQSALSHNSRSMANFCRERGVSFAPHGKTTMSPELFSLQIADGAWAITAANVHQARVMLQSVAPRVLIANEVTAPGDIAWLAHQVDAGCRVMCYVDSLDGVRLLQEGMTSSAAMAPLEVLVELGVPGGRTGSRSRADALEVARTAAESPSLRVVGVAGFEGIISAEGEVSAEDRVDAFLRDLVLLGEDIVAAGLFDGDTARDGEFILTAGGSVYFDRVVDVLHTFRAPVATRIVVRSGCYLTHDDGVIADVSPLGDHPRVHGDVFHAALEVWATVLSRPEPSRLVLGAGKRDVSTDGLLPVMKKWVPRGERSPRDIPGRPRAVRVDDQHAYVDVEPTCPIRVGDFVALGISHPCTTFDKWRVIPIVDDSYQVVEVATTRF